MIERIEAPFSAEQVEALNRYQQGRLTDEFAAHPFTCRDRTEKPHNVRWGDLGVLRATEAGWVCDDCDYTQDWAYKFMAGG